MAAPTPRPHAQKRYLPKSSSDSAGADDSSVMHAWDSSGCFTSTCHGHLNVPFVILSHDFYWPPGTAESRTNALPQSYTNVPEDFNGHFVELSNQTVDPGRFASLQYPFNITPNPTFPEDAQYLPGVNTNYDNHPVIPDFIPSGLDGFGIDPFAPQELAVTFDTPDPIDGLGTNMLAFQESDMIDIPGINVFSAPASSQDQAVHFTPPVVSGAPQSSGEAPLTCPNGCPGTFSRVGEYRRHMKKHGKHAYPCTQPGCSKTFYRKDKMRDHLRQGHKIGRA